MEYMEYNFDTKVQYIKFRVLSEVAKLAFEDNLEQGLLGIPEIISPGPNATMRCCIYKERAILGERIKMAIGGDDEVDNVIQVLTIACDECPVSQMAVGDSCRGCLAHRCKRSCPKGAIDVYPDPGTTDHKAHIDLDKCVRCGKCAEVCPYNAIVKNERPCEHACRADALHMDENQKASIDHEKCVHCGRCVNQCPFGAVVDKSDILSAVRLLTGSGNNQNYHVYAVVAPSIASQFHEIRLGQVVAAIKELGFYDVVEAALGADITAYKEAEELAERGFMTSSCCPAFVTQIRKQFPELAKHISSNLSPMAQIARELKKEDPQAKVVFIGPCIAKKAEGKEERVKEHIDCVITFEEMVALFAAKGVEPDQLEDEELEDASFYGRIFARSGGVTDAVAQAMKERGLDFALNPISCSGIDECRTALLKASKGILKENFIEGMACRDGCIGGPVGMLHGPKDRRQVDVYGKEAKRSTISEAVSGIHDLD